MIWNADKTIADRYIDVVRTCVETKNITDFKTNQDYNNVVGMSTKNQFDVWNEFFKDKNLKNVEYSIHIYLFMKCM